MGWILLFIFIFIVYQLVKPKTPTMPKMSAFDDYLIQCHKASQERADKIPDAVEQPYTPDDLNKELRRNLRWVDDLYLGIIKSGEHYDEEGLRKEAMEVMGVTEKELDELLENYKLTEKKRKK
jgi:hypothetical protein